MNTTSRILRVGAVVALAIAALVATAIPAEASRGQDNTSTTKYWEQATGEKCKKITPGGYEWVAGPDDMAYEVVIVKGGSVDYGDGPGNKVYRDVQPGDVVTAPLNAGGQQAEISHVILCGCVDPKPPTTTTQPPVDETTTTTSTTTPDETTTTTVTPPDPEGQPPVKDTTTTTVPKDTTTTTTPPETTTTVVDPSRGNVVPVCEGVDVWVSDNAERWEFAAYQDGERVVLREPASGGLGVIELDPGTYRIVLVVDQVTQVDAVVTIPHCTPVPTTPPPVVEQPPELPRTGLTLGGFTALGLGLLGAGVMIETWQRRKQRA